MKKFLIVLIASICLFLSSCSADKPTTIKVENTTTTNSTTTNIITKDSNIATTEQTTTQTKDYVVFSSFTFDDNSRRFFTKENEFSYKFFNRDNKNIYEFYTKTDLYDVRVTYQLYNDNNYLREATANFVRLKAWEYKEYVVELVEEDVKQPNLHIKVLMVVYKYC